MSNPAAARPRKRRKRGPVIAAIVVGLGGGLLLSGPLAQFLNSNPLERASKLNNPFAAWTGIGNQDILLLGTDVGGGNTDVITVLRVEGGVTTITQVPRDSYIEAEGYGPHKINALYSLGGTELLKRELSRKLGRPISHHLIVNLSGIRRMADALGGIEVDVPKRMYYVDNSQGLYIDLQPGVQTLKGRELEGFCASATTRWATSVDWNASNWPSRPCSRNSPVPTSWCGCRCCSPPPAKTSRPIWARWSWAA